jgi:hypothetical protein
VERRDYLQVSGSSESGYENGRSYGGLRGRFEDEGNKGRLDDESRKRDGRDHGRDHEVWLLPYGDCKRDMNDDVSVDDWDLMEEAEVSSSEGDGDVYPCGNPR